MQSVRQAANELGISRSKIYELKGEIGFYRIGGKILFAPEDVESFKQRCKVTAVKKPAVTRSAFTQLRPDRLAEAWKKQGVL